MSLKEKERIFKGQDWGKKLWSQKRAKILTKFKHKMTVQANEK